MGGSGSQRELLLRCASDAADAVRTRRGSGKIRCFSGGESSGEESAAGRTTMPARRPGRVVRAFLLGIVLGIAAIFTAAWIAASLAPGP